MLRWGYRWQSRSKAASLLVAGAILLFISFIFVALSVKGAYQAHRLATEGRIATGTVIKKGMHRASDNGTSNTSYDVSYLFTTAEGRQIESSDTVDPGPWDQIVEHGPVAVEYAATDPTINRMKATTTVMAVAYVVLFVGAIVGLLGATLAVMGLLALRAVPVSAGTSALNSYAATARGRNEVERPPILKGRVNPWIVVGGILLFGGSIFLLVGVFVLRQERLFHAEGMTATALVLTKNSHVEYNRQNNSQETKYDVGYRFATPDGRSVQGSDKVDGRTWRSIRERDLIQIVYLPERPTRSRLIANAPGTGPWIVSVLGGALTAGGTLLLGYGFFDAAGKHRKSRK
jgi:uncharacterized membrane protein YiaA